MSETTCLNLATDKPSSVPKFVANCLGGEVNRDEFTSYRWELGIAEVRHEINSNVIPIGKIKLGGQLHRALLFKFLADRIGLPTNLTRGEYGRSYNEILLQNDSHFPIEAYTVDLMFEPGRLMKSTSTEARVYTTVL
ncbi:unnamed protein product [Dicrocoelium dendriticum]|nr:unnamed protein product [Dicrocoelium dendriticum]